MIEDLTVNPSVIGVPEIPEVLSPTLTTKGSWQRVIDSYGRRKDILTRNLKNLYSLVWSQCKSGLEDKLKTLQDYETLKDDCNSIALLIAIREVTLRAGNNNPSRYMN